MVMTRKEITHRSMEDIGFGEAVRSKPDSALAEYDLSEAEIQAIDSGDENRIRSALGQEMEAGVPNSPPGRM
jgi:hypothetical protein